MAWEYGDVVVTRDVIDGKPWVAVPQYVVDDTADLLVTYLPEGAPVRLPPRLRPPVVPAARRGRAAGRSSCADPATRTRCCTSGAAPAASSSAWYVNLEAPFRRTPIGFDYSDEELDIVVLPDGSWSFKDWDLLDEHVANGRYTRRAGGADPRRRPAHRRRARRRRRGGGATSGSRGSPTPSGPRPSCPTAGATSPSDAFSPSKCRSGVIWTPPATHARA